MTLFHHLKDFLNYRKHNVGGRTLRFVGELESNIPDEACHHPVIRIMQNYAVDMIGIENVSNILPITKVTTLLPSFIQDLESYNILNKRSARFMIEIL